jgi:hypothetical protein
MGDTTCLKLLVKYVLLLLYVFPASRTITGCKMFATFEDTCIRQVAVDQWFPLSRSIVPRNVLGDATSTPSFSDSGFDDFNGLRTRMHQGDGTHCF